MPTIVKGEKPHWKAVVVVKGQRREKHFPDTSRQSKRDAIEWENWKRVELKAALTGTPTACCPDVMEWASTCLDLSKASQSPKTYEEKQRVFRDFVKYVGPDTLVSEITLPVVTRFMMDIKKKRSGNVANRCRKNLATAWKTGKKAFQEFPTGHNPFLEADKMPEKREPRYVPPEEDFWKVVNIAKDQDTIMLLFALHTAARRAEIFRAKVEHLDFERSTILISTSKRGNGNTEHDLIPMTATLKHLLEDWLANRPIESDYLFVNLSDHHYASDFYGEPFVARQHFLRRLCKKAGVKPFSWHCIRHLSAAILYDEGESQSVIQNILRHKSPTTTARYIHSLGLKGTRDGLSRVMDGRGV